MENHPEALKQATEALGAFLAAGNSGNSSDFLAKLEALYLIIKEKDRSLAQGVPLEPLIASLDVYGWNPDVCRIVYGLIELIIKTSDFVPLIEKFEPALVAAARHPDSALAKLTVQALKLGLTPDNVEMLVKTEFFKVLVKRIASPDADLSEAIFVAVRDAKVYAKYPSLFEELLTEAAYEQGVKDVMLVVLEVLCNLRKQVPDASSTFIGLDDFIKSDDLLYRLCAIQIAIQNADSQHDFDLLSGESGLIEYLVAQLPINGEFILNDEPIYCKAMGLFANLMKVPTTDWTRFAGDLLTGLTVILDTPSEAVNDAVYLVGCMLCNASMKGHFEQVQEKYFDAFPSSNPSIRAVCLFSAGAVLSGAAYPEHKQLVLEKGLGAMGPQNPFENLQEACLSSIDEVKEAGYTCLRQLLGQKHFAEQAMMHSSLFLFLTNRLADLSASGLQAKYGIIEGLLQQDWASAIFNAPMQASFTKYLSQGVFYNDQAAPQVALQS